MVTNLKRYRIKLGIVIALILMVPLTALYAQSAGISQGFKTTETNLAAGALMSFKSGEPNAVELATSSTANQLAGIIDEKALVSLSSSSNEVQLVTSGSTRVLVSNINGSVKISDKITASPIAGVGMKATSNTQIVGTVQEDFDESKATSQVITDKDGTSRTIKIGLVPVQINITYFAAEQEKKTPLPPFIQELANSIGGKEVSLLRIIISGILLLLGFMSTAILLYTSVKSSIISIGRNPLSRQSVYRGLLNMGLLIIAILAATIGAAYLVIRL